MILILVQQHDEAYELGVREGVLKTRAIVTSEWKAMDWKMRDWQRDVGERWQAWLGERERAGREGKDGDGDGGARYMEKEPSMGERSRRNVYLKINIIRISNRRAGRFGFHPHTARCCSCSCHIPKGSYHTPLRQLSYPRVHSVS